MGYSKFAVNSVLLNLWAKQLRYLFGESVLSDFRILPAVYSLSIQKCLSHLIFYINFGHLFY
jgi:hypothetical protein